MEENISHSADNTEKESIWYTYFGKGGAAAFAFIWVAACLFWIIEVIRIG